MKVVCKRPTLKRRIVLAAAFGAFCACIVAIIDPLTTILAILLEYVLVSVFMVLIAYPYNSRSWFIRTYIVFLLSAFFLGGMMQSIYSKLGAKTYVKTLYDEVISQNITVASLIVISLILTPFIFYGYHMLRESKQNTSNIYDITMYFTQEDSFSCKGLMDTGNCLKDPILGWPVVIVDKNLLKEKVINFQEKQPNCLCVIPYASVGKDHGILYGVRLEQIIIKDENNEICTKNVVVALSEHGFLNTEYRALLHCDLLKL